MVTSDTIEQGPLWEKFFSNPAIELLLRTINLVLERLDPEYVQGLNELKQAIIDQLASGALTKGNPCHMPCLAVHFNQDGSVHTDRKSSHASWDVVQAFGRFLQSILEFPDLHTEIITRPTDLVLMRGAALRHNAKDWADGEGGRMVIVPFYERRLFSYLSVRKVKQLRNFFHNDQKELKKLVPVQPLRHD